MALSLTSTKITPERGNAALLPNQPIIQGCRVAATESATLVPGDVVALATGGSKDTIVVKKAAVTDLPVGVVVGNPIKSGFVAGDMISYFPTGCYYFAKSASATIARGTKVQFNDAGDVLATTTASNGYIGIAHTAAEAQGDLVIVQVQPSK